MKVPIPSFDRVRLLVVGDVMLDRYWYGGTTRISPEAPVPVVRVEETEERPGGAGNVALNAAALGVKPTVIGVAGRDEAAHSLIKHLEAGGVECGIQQAPDISTVTKLRVISRHQQLIRLDFEDELEAFDGDALLSLFERSMPVCDAVVISDYGKGTVTDPREYIQRARSAGKPVLVDPRGTDYSRYSGATLITPNLAEFASVAGPCDTEQELVSKARGVIRDYVLGGLLITRGEHGMTLFRPGHDELHMPAQAKEVFDVTGAGDTVVSVMASALGAGASMGESMALANAAAGIVVGKLGAATVALPELRVALASGRDARSGVVTQEQLLNAVSEARAEGIRIVMTNGCFDILHAGHVSYLDEAAKLGDRLIVAVNDDPSVRALKGEGRPVNTLERRMAVLAALKCVDWVAPFSGQTPESLICAVTPDVLVKGGDYRLGQIAGHDCVRKAGGEVVVLGYEESISTSGIIEEIKTSPGTGK